MWATDIESGISRPVVS